MIERKQDEDLTETNIKLQYFANTGNIFFLDKIE